MCHKNKPLNSKQHSQSLKLFTPCEGVKYDSDQFFLNLNTFHAKSQACKFKLCQKRFIDLAPEIAFRI